ncbi:MAG: hypothetical protein GY773_05125, partial [Actinomycetia bacterium]|nr:hypothetical protein [Actinomycetes bacterium]
MGAATAMINPVLHVQMLGGLSLHLGDEPLGPVPSRSASSLLALLILYRDRAQTRDLLAGRFWSDLSEDKARRRLSNALWQIRTVVAARHDSDSSEDDEFDLLATTPQTVQLNPDVEVIVDLDIFIRRLDDFERRYRTERRGVRIADLTSIVESYRGELLSGHYDEWINGPRRIARDRYLGAL